MRRTKPTQKKAVGEVSFKSDEPVQELDETVFLFSVNLNNRDKDSCQVDLELNSKLTNFKIDTGADITVISEVTYNSLLPMPPLQSSKAVPCSPGGAVHCVGEIKAVLSYKSVNYPVRVFVLRGENVSCLLAGELSCKMGLVKRVHEITDHKCLETLGY